MILIHALTFLPVVQVPMAIAHLVYVAIGELMQKYHDQLRQAREEHNDTEGEWPEWTPPRTPPTPTEPQVAQPALAPEQQKAIEEAEKEGDSQLAAGLKASLT